MITTLYLIRHGESESNLQRVVAGSTDTPLTKQGIEQAQEVANAITKEVDVLLYSPLIRAQQTAEILIEALGVTETEESEDLRERDFGALEGVVIDRALLLADRVEMVNKTPWIMNGDGVEPLEDVWRRMEGFLEWLQERHGGKTVVLVGHGATLQMLRGVLEDKTWEEAMELPVMENAEVLEYSE